MANPKLCFYGYTRPTTPKIKPRYNNTFYSEQDKRDIVWLIDQGYKPLDVAVAFGVPVFCYRRTQRGKPVVAWESTIYANYARWKAEFEFREIKARSNGRVKEQVNVCGKGFSGQHQCCRQPPDDV